ncbi:MAG: diaminopimelate decarboxylase [Bacilli bacterium]|nr:diaminopimelate decarboxylase [Bacilli bacterium]MDY4052327.1 diaminopimelate decarboxylase [Bacilli bacterium]
MRPTNLKVINDELYLNNVSLTSLANQYKTPLYVFDEFELEEKMDEFKDYFCSEKFMTEIVYASKAFLVPEICKMASKKGLMIDAVSLGDLYVINYSGFPLTRVVFHGNNKSDEELEYAVKNNVGIIVVDNLDELQRLNKVAKHYQKSINTLFRVNPGIDAHTHKYIQTALFVSKFGESIYDEVLIDKIIKEYLESKYVKLLGFHSHIGSQIKAFKPFLLNIEKMIDFSKNIEEKYQIKLPYLNLGGGFGIQYYEDDTSFDTPKLLNRMIKHLEKLSKEKNYHLEKVFIEPGRSIVGNAGISLYTCGITKHTYGGKNYLFIDGGMTDNIRPALYQAIYQCEVINKVTKKKEIVVDVAGKCCESGDIIAKDVLLPQTKPGDILVVYATGAYTYSMASSYNNHLKPKVLFIGDTIKEVSKEEPIEDLIKLF